MKEAERRARLSAWLKTIEDDIGRVALGNYFFWRLQRIIRANRALRGRPGDFLRWIAWNYVDSTVIGIRRQLKNRTAQNKCVSLRGVLSEIEQYPELVSRAHYLSLRQGAAWQGHLDVAHEQFDRIAGPGGSHIRLSVVRRDTRRLKTNALVAVEDWADRRTAHWHDRYVPARTFNDLRNGLRTIEAVLNRYLAYVRGYSVANFAPTIQYDWEEALRIPWILPRRGA